MSLSGRSRFQDLARAATLRPWPSSLTCMPLRGRHARLVCDKLRKLARKCGAREWRRGVQPDTSVHQRGIHGAALPPFRGSRPARNRRGGGRRAIEIPHQHRCLTAEARLPPFSVAVYRNARKMQYGCARSCPGRNSATGFPRANPALHAHSAAITPARIVCRAVTEAAALDAAQAAR